MGFVAGTSRLDSRTLAVEKGDRQLTSLVATVVAPLPLSGALTALKDGSFAKTDLRLVSRTGGEARAAP
jgi:hypothetical protein